MIRRAAALATVAFVGTACGGGIEAPAVTGAWARPTPAGATDAVVYFELRVPARDTLVKVSVDPAVAAAASFHTTTGAGGGAPHHGGTAGATTTITAAEGTPAGVTTTVVATVAMEALESVTLLPGKATVFAPGGNHVMLERLARPLVEGDRFDLTLSLASGASVVAPVAVTMNRPG